MKEKKMEIKSWSERYLIEHLSQKMSPASWLWFPVWEQEGKRGKKGQKSGLSES